MTWAVISGGGTGGHTVPGLAVAGALVAAGHAAAGIHFIGSTRGMEGETVPAAGFTITTLPGRGLERRLSLSNLGRAWDILRAVGRGVRLVRRLRPAVVLTLGGYAAVPGALGAVMWRVPLVIAEQNAVASLANRLVARAARAAAVPVAGTGLRREVVTGNPVRAEVVAARDADRDELRRRLGVPPDRTLVLVFGGSQGALTLNRAVAAALPTWSGRADLALYHVVGRRDWTDLAVPTLPEGGLWYRPVEFEHRLPEVMAAADLAVCRSGASTVAELAVIGRPAVLVPFPHAPKDAQGANAAMLVDAGAAVLVRDHALDGDRLAAEVVAMLGRDLGAMAGRARSVGHPDAAVRVAELLEVHASRPDRTPAGPKPRSPEAS
jgi:undecaprenyldiphospho-muramoylpentapeptide beta-N-acetylglucosaminyltransferase